MRLVLLFFRSCAKRNRFGCWETAGRTNSESIPNCGLCHLKTSQQRQTHAGVTESLTPGHVCMLQVTAMFSFSVRRLQDWRKTASQNSQSTRARVSTAQETQCSVCASKRSAGQRKHVAQSHNPRCHFCWLQHASCCTASYVRLHLACGCLPRQSKPHSQVIWCATVHWSKPSSYCCSPNGWKAGEQENRNKETRGEYNNNKN